MSQPNLQMAGASSHGGSQYGFDARHELPCLAAQVSIIPSRAGRRLVTRRPRSSLLGGCVVQKGKRGRLHVLLAP